MQINYVRHRTFVWCDSLIRFEQLIDEPEPDDIHPFAVAHSAAFWTYIAPTRVR
jgi:hypothetical protein